MQKIKNVFAKKAKASLGGSKNAEALVQLFNNLSGVSSRASLNVAIASTSKREISKFVEEYSKALSALKLIESDRIGYMSWRDLLEMEQGSSFAASLLGKVGEASNGILVITEAYTPAETPLQKLRTQGIENVLTPCLENGQPVIVMAGKPQHLNKAYNAMTVEDFESKKPLAIRKKIGFEATL